MYQGVESRMEYVRFTSLWHHRKQRIHSANQLSIHGAVASWCEDLAQRFPGQTHVIMENSVAKENEQLLQEPEPQEVISLVQTQGGMMRRLTKACESPWFKRRVSIGMHYKTVHDVNDGFEGTTAGCPNSKVTAWIDGHPKIGPVLHVNTTCCLGIYGIEIQIPSTTGDGSKSWVVIS